jgi:hypothetical protein
VRFLERDCYHGEGVHEAVWGREREIWGVGGEGGSLEFGGFLIICFFVLHFALPPSRGNGRSRRGCPTPDQHSQRCGGKRGCDEVGF